MEAFSYSVPGTWYRISIHSFMTIRVRRMRIYFCDSKFLYYCWLPAREARSEHEGFLSLCLTFDSSGSKLVFAASNQFDDPLEFLNLCAVTCTILNGAAVQIYLDLPCGRGWLVPASFVWILYKHLIFCLDLI